MRVIGKKLRSSGVKHCGNLKKKTKPNFKTNKINKIHLMKFFEKNERYRIFHFQLEKSYASITSSTFNSTSTCTFSYHVPY